MRCFLSPLALWLWTNTYHIHLQKQYGSIGCKLCTCKHFTIISKKFKRKKSNITITFYSWTIFKNFNVPLISLLFIGKKNSWNKNGFEAGNFGSKESFEFSIFNYCCGLCYCFYIIIVGLGWMFLLLQFLQCVCAVLCFPCGQNGIRLCIQLTASCAHYYFNFVCIYIFLLLFYETILLRYT